MEGMARLLIASLLFLMLFGCGPSGRTMDLDSRIGKVSTGMTELQVTQALGAPSHIDTSEPGTRKLRYNGDSGGYILVTLVQDRVTDARRF